MIINIRGFFGSGKSSLVRRLVNEAGLQVVETAGPFDVYSDGWVSVLGRYGDPTTTAGGDSVEGDLGREVLQRYSRQGAVIIESAKWSNRPPQQTLPILLEEGAIMACLDTPYEECIRRIYERRERTGRGHGRPLKADSDWGRTKAYPLVERYFRRCAEQGLVCVYLDHQGDAAYWQLLQMLRDAGWSR